MFVFFFTGASFHFIFFFNILKICFLGGQTNYGENENMEISLKEVLHRTRVEMYS